MKKIVFLILAFAIAVIANAKASGELLYTNDIEQQTFEFRYHGESLADGATVVIQAEEDEWGFGEMNCYTNPSSDPNNGLILKILSGSQNSGDATIKIEENTLFPERILWCMGGTCMTVLNPSITKPFTADNGICQVQFDAENIQSEGHLLATLVATINGESHTVNILFNNGDQSVHFFDFMVDGIAYSTNADGTSVTVTSGGNYSDAVIIPAEVTYEGITYSVTAIGNSAFKNCSGLSAVIIPNTVTSIGTNAFSNCSNLTFVAIPGSVTTMGNQVFYGCYSLQSMLLLGTACDYFTSGATSVRNLFLAPCVTSINGLGVSPNQVYCYGTVPPVCDASTFNSYSGTLHVPHQGLAPYFADQYWGNFNSFNGDAVWPQNMNITLSEVSVNMKIGETAQLIASIDSIPTGMPTLWFSTNSNVVEVGSNGSLSAKTPGEALAIAVCGDHFATCHVAVEEETITIELDKSELALNMDDIATITPSHSPSMVPVEYAFTCSDNDVVMTQWKNGAIRLLATKPGTAVITVGSSDGNAVPATCEVTVRRPLGDVNVDGRVTSADITALYDFILNDDETNIATSDINGDGDITSSDITMLYSVLLGVPFDNHEYVDLGLPSGTLWATMNVGANNPEEYGDYFAWGETTPKDVYYWSTYKWCSGNGERALIKYCTNSSWGNNGFVDNKTELDPEDDAATANWGPDWRMPSREQIQELVNNCTRQWTTLNGVNGRLFTSNINGASLFLPASGSRWDGDYDGVSSWGYYWSRTLEAGYPSNAISLNFLSDGVNWEYYFRYCGFSVRPVRILQK